MASQSRLDAVKGTDYRDWQQTMASGCAQMQGSDGLHRVPAGEASHDRQRGQLDPVVIHTGRAGGHQRAASIHERDDRPDHVDFQRPAGQERQLPLPWVDHEPRFSFGLLESGHVFPDRKA